jgi:hypothetical protein
MKAFDEGKKKIFRWIAKDYNNLIKINEFSFLLKIELHFVHDELIVMNCTDGILENLFFFFKIIFLFIMHFHHKQEKKYVVFEK